MEKTFNKKNFAIISAVVLVWFAVAELPRYFLYVRPAMMDYLSAIPNMGRFGLFEVLPWSFLSVMLTVAYVFIYWLCAVAFGNNKKAVIISATATWLFIFVFYWVASATMLTAQWSNLLVTLPLAFIETLGASFIAYKMYSKKGLH